MLTMPHSQPVKTITNLVLGLGIITTLVGVAFIVGTKQVGQNQTLPFQTQPVPSRTPPRPQPSQTLRVNNPSALLTVTQFYEYVGNRQYTQAFNLLSQKYKKNIGDYRTFANGYNQTSAVRLKEIRVNEPSTSSVFVRATANDTVDTVPTAHEFAGNWELVSENGIWKLDSATIHIVQ